MQEVLLDTIYLGVLRMVSAIGPVYRRDHFADGLVQADEDGTADDIVADVEFGDIRYGGQ